MPPKHKRQIQKAEDADFLIEEVEEVVQAEPGSAEEEKEELAALNWLEDDLADSIANLNTDAYCTRVHKEAKFVGEETTSPGLANMLAEMRCDMQRLSEPAYRRLLQRKLSDVQKDQQEMLRRIEDRKRREREPEPSPEPSVSKSAPKPAAPTTTGAPKENLHAFREKVMIVIGAIAILACLIGVAFMYGTSSSHQTMAA